MIKFRPNRVDRKNNNTPILSDSEIDDLAEMLLADYKPRLLKEPQEINYLHFLESYLGANIAFEDIYYEEGEQPIFGATSFNTEYMKVFDCENMCIKAIKLESRTIVIDNYVMMEGKEGLALFTALHEAGHLWIHPGVFTKISGQISMFRDMEISPIVCCRRSSIENFGKKKSLETAKDFREHHADYFASAIAMPKSTFIPLAKEIIKAEGISDNIVIEDLDIEHNWFANEEFPNKISKVYGVSKQAAYIKLRKFGFITDTNTQKVQNKQLKLL